jgi:DNA-binding CsgD family transcriptional regulator
MTAVREGTAERVVERFLEAAAAPELWPDALHELALACGAEGAAAHSSDGLRTLATVASEGVAELHDGFVNRWSAPELNSHRARGIALIRKGWRGALTEQHCFSRDDLAADPFQQEFFIRSGYSSFAGMILGQTASSTLSVSVIRRIGQGEYSRDEIAFINRLSRHLRAASTVALRLGMSATARLSDAFAMTGKPVAVLGRDGRVVHMTASFEGLLNGGLRLKAGRLECREPAANKTLTAAIERAICYEELRHEPLNAVVLPRREGLRPLVAHIVPVVGRVHDLLHLAAALVTLTDLEAMPAGPIGPILERAFSLTPAEARLAAQLVTGKSLAEIAAAERVAYETLRGHLKSVFEKTRTGRQAELVSLIARLAGAT